MSLLSSATAPPSVCAIDNNARRPATALRRSGRQWPIRCATEKVPARKYVQYLPNLRTAGDIQSCTRSFEVEEEHKVRKFDILKEKTRNLIYEKKEVEEQLQLIDNLQQLGVAYHFKDEIEDALRGFHGSLNDIINLQLKDNLHASAQLFRLLRENGFSVTDDVDIFRRFKSEKKAHLTASVQDTEGILSLYEASYYAKEGEVILDEAMDFTTKHLINLLDKGFINEPGLRERVAHSLELPLNWRFQRLHTRWFIEHFSRSKTEHMNPLLLDLAKLDFNAVQDMHKDELKQLSRWWTDLGLAQHLPFFRDRLTFNFLWTVGGAFEPQFGSSREVETKANCFIAMLDDVYDVYGTLEELELITDAIDRWDVNAIEKFPDYLKLCFLAIFNTANDAAYRITKEKGLDILPYLKRAWRDLCNAFLVEAKWSHRSYTPTLQEYLDNAWISASCHVFLTHAYCTSPYLTKQDLENFNAYPKLLQHSSVIFRLNNDLVESESSGDASSIHSLMQEKGVSEAEARGEVKKMIMDNWKAMNGDRVNYTCGFEENFKICAINLARMSHFFYRNIDRYSEAADGEIKNAVTSILEEHITL
ncbi:monoterpene synthase 8, chloroplastic-like [Curcuma longa]|uniref:monoterpene synthase 8, chloroplastic-like n=1 Tax=Curcuma longa TaxID=136217 RepID=UPI003D9DC57A